MLELSSDHRAQIISALAFPRQLMQREVERQVCELNHRYDADQPHCSDCLYGLECESQCQLLEMAHLQVATAGQLSSLLQFAIEYVEQLSDREDHNPRCCGCEPCDWLRHADGLVAAF